MRYFPPPEALRDLAELKVVLSLDQETDRPVIAIEQSFGGKPGSFLRYALSPSAAVPAQLLADISLSFEQALAGLVGHLFGIAEELELRHAQGCRQVDGGLSTGS